MDHVPKWYIQHFKQLDLQISGEKAAIAIKISFYILIKIFPVVSRPAFKNSIVSSLYNLLKFQKFKNSQTKLHW